MERGDTADSLNLFLPPMSAQPPLKLTNKHQMDTWMNEYMKWHMNFSLVKAVCNIIPSSETTAVNWFTKLTRLGGGKKGYLWNKTEESTTQTRRTGHHAKEDPWSTTQKRGTGNHAKDDPGGRCVSSVLGFCWSSYLPIIVECCWTAASRSLSSIVHSPISVHPEKTRAQRHSVQIPPKKKRVISRPVSLWLSLFSVSKASDFS